MKRILAISDIHGMFDEFIEMLHKVNYNPENDQLILLGDYVDRGPKSKDVIECIMHLVQEQGAIALKGNHDDMFVKHVVNDLEEDSFRHMKNGGLTTFQSYYCRELEFSALPEAKKYVKENFWHHIEFLKDLPYYFETVDYIFVHAGINPDYDDWKETPERDLLWIRDAFFNRELQIAKKVVFGHTICMKFHGTYDVWFGRDKIGIDGGCVYGYQLNCLEINGEGIKTYVVLNKAKQINI